MGFREKSLEIPNVRCIKDLLPQNFLSKRVRLLSLEKSEEKLSRKGTTYKKKPPEMNITPF